MGLIRFFIVLTIILYLLIFVKFFKDNKRIKSILLVSLFFIVVVVYLFYIHKSKKQEIIGELFAINFANIDSLKVIDYKYYNSYDYKTNIFYISERPSISLFFQTLNNTERTSVEINFRMYKTTRDIRIQLHPAIYENLVIEVFSFEELGTFVGLSINDYNLAYYKNDSIGLILDTIIRQSEASPGLP